MQIFRYGIVLLIIGWIIGVSSSIASIQDQKISNNPLFTTNKDKSSGLVVSGYPSFQTGEIFTKKSNLQLSLSKKLSGTLTKNIELSHYQKIEEFETIVPDADVICLNFIAPETQDKVFKLKYEALTVIKFNILESFDVAGDISLVEPWYDYSEILVDTLMKYKNPLFPIEVRVEDLLSRMALEEKLGQLNMPYHDMMAKELPGKIDACRKFAEGKLVTNIGPTGGFWAPTNMFKESPPASG